MIDPDFIWPDDRFELLSRLSPERWTPLPDLIDDLGWSRERLKLAILEIRELQIVLRASAARDAIKLSRRSWSLAQIAIAGFEKRMDDAEEPLTWYGPMPGQVESESMK